LTTSKASVICMYSTINLYLKHIRRNAPLWMNDFRRIYRPDDGKIKFQVCVEVPRADASNVGLIIFIKQKQAPMQSWMIPLTA
jgi:hypothetical protein